MKALITGASSGIGRDMAKILSKKGYDLVLVARDEEKLQEVKKEIETNSQIISMDLSVEKNCKKLYEQVKDVDLLINNAGFGTCGDFTKTNLDKEINMINTNITAYHILTKLYLKDMKQKDKGQILNVASIAGFMPGPLMATYYATKAYVLSLTRSVSKEIEKTNVTISALCPGPVKTEFNKVAGVEFAVGGMTGGQAARIAVRGMMRGKRVIIPGVMMKIAKFLTKILPDRLLTAFAYRFQKAKETKNG